MDIRILELAGERRARSACAVVRIIDDNLSTFIEELPDLILASLRNTRPQFLRRLALFAFLAFDAAV